MDYTAVWHNLISDTWAQILAAGSDGTYAQKYSVGDVAMLDLGTEGVVPFELVAKDADVLADNTGSAHMTWLALSPLETQRPMGFKGTGAMNSYGGFSLVAQGAEGTMYRSAHISGNQGCASQFTITANEALSMKIVFSCSSEENFDMMSASVNGEWVVCGFGKAEVKT